MANHTKSHIDDLIGRLYSARDEVKADYQAYRAVIAEKTALETHPAWRTA
jgi:hypothetical protein